MIDAFYIFTKGGLLLWSTQLVKIKGEPIDRLIKEALLEERLGENFCNLDPYNLKWKLVNEMDLFFVVVYQGILQITYLEGLLEAAAKEFMKSLTSLGGFDNGMSIKRVEFDAEFRKVLQKTDAALMESKRSRPMKTFADTKKGQEVLKNKADKGELPSEGKRRGKKGGKGEDGDSDEDEDDEGGEAEPASPASPASPAAAKGPKPFQKKVKETSSEQKSKKGKEARTWDHSGKVSAKTIDSLDFSKGKPGAGDGSDEEAAIQKKRDELIGSDAEEASVASLSADSDEEAETPAKSGRVGGLFKSLTRNVKNLTGGATLTDADLDPILKSFKTSLMAKNVGVEVADKLADSVRHSLVNKRTEKFTTMAATVKSTLSEAMETLLTPKKSIDVLRAALAAKSAGRVYTIVFLGVNGVGKSTNLSKVAYYLKQKGGLNVLMAACDTFRAGAVEQLRTHSRCLDVPLFERGYGKDPSDIAKHAIQHAASNQMDVVLVDTAGRMQDNEPLMKALAKLVAVNTPDLVLFVGEALVGNDAIDQVTKFNRALIDMSPDPRKPRGIDGMLLTKYDTVDDKVGAALSMVYVTGQPVIFVGCGQKYTHLKKMCVKEVVSTLLG